MIRINLLPVSERQPKWPINSLLWITGMSILLVLSSIYSYNLYEVWNLERQLQQTRAQYQLLQPTRIVMEKARKKEEKFNQKNYIAMLLTKEHRSWHRVIQHLTTVPSPHIWFTELVKSDQGTIQIKGWAASYPLVSEFVQRIEQDEFFIEPVLISVEQNLISQIATFEIRAKPRGI